MKIHSMLREVRNKNVQCLSGPEQVPRAVAYQYYEAKVVKISAIVTDDFIIRRSELGQRFFAHVNDKQS
jgi:hypothetical protein